MRFRYKERKAQTQARVPGLEKSTKELEEETLWRTCNECVEEASACLLALNALDVVCGFQNSCRQNHSIVVCGCQGTGKNEVLKAICQSLITWDECIRGHFLEPLCEEKPLLSKSSATGPLGCHTNPFLLIEEDHLDRTSTISRLRAFLCICDAFCLDSTSSSFFTSIKLGYDTSGVLAHFSFQASALDPFATLLRRDDKVDNWTSNFTSMYQIFQMVAAMASKNEDYGLKVLSQELQSLKIGENAETLCADAAEMKRILGLVDMSEYEWKEMMAALMAVIHLQVIEVTGKGLAESSAEGISALADCLGISAKEMNGMLVLDGATREDIRRYLDDLSLEVWSIFLSPPFLFISPWHIGMQID